MNRNRIATYILIGALAFVFGYFGIDKFASPIVWIGWMPPWMEGLLGLTRDTWLQVFGAIEIVLAILLVIPVRTVRITAAGLIMLHLLGILTQTGWNDVAVRDIGLLFSAGTLLVLLL